MENEGLYDLPRAPVPGQLASIVTVLETWQVAPKPFKLEWVTGDDLNCDYGQRFLVADGCYGGATYLEPGRVALMRVAWRDTRYSDTQLAHELCHVHFYDPDHQRECDEAQEWLSGATKALVREGL